MLIVSCRRHAFKWVGLHYIALSKSVIDTARLKLYRTTQKTGNDQFRDELRLAKLDESYPPQTRIRLLLDNHSAHISKETQGWLSLHPQRFEFVFTPKHGSWLNIVETMFSKMARSMLRAIRVKTKQELVDRIHLYFQQINADPVIFPWKYKMEQADIG